MLLNFILINKTLSYYKLFPLSKNNIGKIHFNMKKTNNINYNFNPKTINQEKYFKSLKDPIIKILFVIGPAGTGKTYLACNEAITLLKNGLINKIILTRPIVTVEEDLGFLPGNIIKKMDPWTKPIIDVFEEKYSKQDIDKLIQNNIIEISPLAYMRGRTFKNCYIIADEMQNSSPNQMLMLTTRLGENSKMIITGDLKQTDKPTISGLSDFLFRFNYYRDNHYPNENNNFLIKNDTGISIVELDNSDIQRSKVVGKILNIYDNKIIYNNVKVNNSISNNIRHYSHNSDAALIPKYLDS